MKHFYLPAAGLGLALIGLVGCVDDNYHINDANTLSRIKINDLTVPLNLDKIYLDSIVDLTDGTNVEKYTDPATGKEYYALTEKGEVNSDDIEISEISTDAADINSSTVPVAQSGASGSAANFPMAETSSQFVYTARDIDSSVKTITGLQTVNPVKAKLVLSLPSELKLASTKVENIELVFPKGLHNADGTAAKANVGEYNPTTGILKVASHTFTDPRKAEFSVTFEAFDFKEADAKIDANTRVFTYKGEMGINKKGQLSLTPSAGNQVLQNFDFKVDYDLAAFDVRNFSGTVDYAVENTSVEPIHLDDLPDFLQDPQTMIIINNPQFYFSINNPTSPYGTGGEGEVAISSHFNNNASYSSKSPQITIKPEPVTDICLSPSGDVENPLDEYKDNLSQVKYPEMKYLLSGDPVNGADGMPSEINVSFDNPRLKGTAVRFPVKNAKYKEKIGRMHGTYEFFAPLSFDANSVILYSETADIGGDVMKDIYVEYLTIDAQGISTFPVDVQLSAVARDVEGKVLGHSNKLDLKALSQDPVNLVIRPEEGMEVMNDIDSLEFHAFIRQEETGEGEALAPDQGLELKDLRIRVSGYYEKKF